MINKSFMFLVLLELYVPIMQSFSLSVSIMSMKLMPCEFCDCLA